MARVNINILGISELKWTEMGEFNSDDHYLYYYRQESLRRNGVVIIINKSLKCSTWMQSQKWQNNLRLFPRQTIQYYSNPSLCPNQNAEKAKVEWVYEDLQDLLYLTPQKDVLFIIEDWNAKVGIQKIPGITSKFGLGVQHEASQRLTEFCLENTLVTSNTLFQQHKVLNMDITRWPILKSDWLYYLQPKMEKLHIVSKSKTWSWLWFRSWTPYCKIQT